MTRKTRRTLSGARAALIAAGVVAAFIDVPTLQPAQLTPGEQQAVVTALHDAGFAEPATLQVVPAVPRRALILRTRRVPRVIQATFVMSGQVTEKDLEVFGMKAVRVIHETLAASPSVDAYHVIVCRPGNPDGRYVYLGDARYTEGKQLTWERRR
jgi:hypothetical protein